MKVQLFFSAALLLLLPLFFDAAFAADRSIIVGGWVDRNPKDKDIVDIAIYLVVDHNLKTGEELQFKDVVFAQSQVVAGVNYRVVIAVNNGKVGYSLLYLGKAYEQAWKQVTEVTEFKPIIE